MRVDPEATLKPPPSTLNPLGFGAFVRQDEGMPTPYERPAGSPETGSAPRRATERRAARRAFGRPSEGKVLAGVAAGLAEHLGWNVRLVRIAFILLCFPTGAGLVAYVFLWALSPQTVAGLTRGEVLTLEHPVATLRRGTWRVARRGAG